MLHSTKSINFPEIYYYFCYSQNASAGRMKWLHGPDGKIATTLPKGKIATTLPHEAK